MRRNELTCKISSTEILSSWQGKFWISVCHSYVRFFNINFVTTSARAHNFVVAGFISDSLISQLFSTPTIESQFSSIFAISADTSLILTSPDCVSRIVSGPRVASARPSPRRYWIPSNTYSKLISNAPASDFIGSPAWQFQRVHRWWSSSWRLKCDWLTLPLVPKSMCMKHHDGNIRAILGSLDGRLVPSVLGNLWRERTVFQVVGYAPTSLFPTFFGQISETDLGMIQRQVQKYPMGSDSVVGSLRSGDPGVAPLNQVWLRRWPFSVLLGVGYAETPLSLDSAAHCRRPTHQATR